MTKLLSYNSIVLLTQTANKCPRFRADAGAFSWLNQLCKSLLQPAGALGFVMSGTMAVMGVVAYTRVPSMVKNYASNTEARADKDDS